MTAVPLEVRLQSTLASARPALSAVQPRTIFSTWEYLHSWWSVFGRGTLLCVEGIRNGAVQIVAPLFADQGMVYFIGSGGSDYLDFLGDAVDPEALESVLRLAMNSTPDFCGFCFYHVPDHSPTGRILQTISPALGLTPCVHYSLPAPVLTFASALSPPARKKSLARDCSVRPR